MKKHHAYIVTWRDSATLRGWMEMDSKHHGVTTITSVGWLVRETKTELTIATCISENGNTRDAVTIPREAITKRTRLRNYVAGPRS